MFIPKTIKVGYQNRQGTYTGKLAYIIYYDEKNKLRKETSWNGWRDNDIEPNDFENIPMSGFVLNKNVGGYSTGWNHRNSYIRVYDPRGFEFEIGLENLLYILENTSSIKGKGLEGEFIYGWNGKDLVLIPTSSPDYIEIQKYNSIIHDNKTIKAKELKFGGRYLTKDNKEVVYLGKYNYSYYSNDSDLNFWFCDLSEIDGRDYSKFIQRKTLSKYLIEELQSDCDSRYASLVDDVMNCKYYSPIDESKTVYNVYEFEEFEEMALDILNRTRRWYTDKVYSDEFEKNEQIDINKVDNKLNITRIVKVIEEWNDRYYGRQTREERRSINVITTDDIELIFKTIKPKYKTYYLKNGNLLKGVKNNEQYK